MAAKKRFSVYITESQPDLSGQVPLRAVLCPAVIVEGRLWAQAIARSQGMPRPAAPHAACLPASSDPGESHGRHSGSRCRPGGGLAAQSEDQQVFHQPCDSSYITLELPWVLSDALKMSFAVRKWPKPCATSMSPSPWSWTPLLGKRRVLGCDDGSPPIPGWPGAGFLGWRSESQS